MNEIAATRTRKRCAVYCRVSSDERLDQKFNSIDAQKEAGQAYIASQRAEGWIAVADDYDDPAFSGGNMERPALKRLMSDIEAGECRWPIGDPAANEFHFCGRAPKSGSPYCEAHARKAYQPQLLRRDRRAAG